MEELSVRRNRGFAVTRYQPAGRTEKAAAAPQRSAAGQPTDVVSETLRRLIGRVNQTGDQVREGRRALQSGEAALAEVEEHLGRMEELARRASQDGAADREALQTELESLRDSINRIAQNGVSAGLFQDADGSDSTDALADALLDGLNACGEGTEGLPAWLLRAAAGAIPDRQTLLAELGLRETAGSGELLAALARLPLESSSAGCLAGLYLGAVIAGGVPTGAVDPELAAQGLKQLLELVSEGLPPDQALELLTGGIFTSFDDFQAQFSGGTAPGLEAFLTGLLLTGEEQAAVPLAALLAGSGEGELDLLMDLLAVLDASGSGSGAGSEVLPEGSGTAGEGASPQWESAEWGTIRAAGRELSGVSLDGENGVLTADNSSGLILRGRGDAPAIRLTGSGAVTLQEINTPLLTAEAAQGRVISVGRNTLAQVRLGEDAVLVLDGGGLSRIDSLRGEGHAVLRLTGGAVSVARSQEVQLVIDGPVSLLAPAEAAVYDVQGRPLTPLDIVWKTMLPGWSSLTALAVDGKQKQLLLTPEDHPDLMRLWLWKGNDAQGYPAHSVVLQGRDRSGQLSVRYAYLRWDRRAEAFREIVMYPNPFRITGGEEETDWHYEQETQTLRILSAQVTAVSGGPGTDGELQPFSGRLALADGIGKTELTLENVTCRVSVGRAFSLGRGNDVTLLLPGGSENIFESGPGCAGISLGPGTSVRIDRIKGPAGEPEGRLIATGGSGGAGIGRDSGAGRERSGTILIRGGIVIAAGTGGGAGIGGALGAPAGDIRIQGGTVTAKASCCAAAIGAGIQGACGNITITSTAHVANAQGGGPDGDIGGCLFGNCGKLQIAPGIDLGGAKLHTSKGFSLQVGEATLTLPKFRVSARALRLDAVDLSTREAAQAALTVLAADRRWVGRLKGAYGLMYGQLAQSVSGLYAAQRYFGVVREDSVAAALLRDARQTLRRDPLAAYRLWAMENVGALLR